MEPKEKLAVCSVISNSHLIYLKVFIYSILRHNPKFDREYVVFYKDGDIAEVDFNQLKKIYKNFIFKKIPTEKYREKIGETHAKQSKHSQSIRLWTYYRIEMFSLIEYDQIIWFDVDMLVINSLDDLFKMRYNEGILACEDIIAKHIVKDNRYERDHKVQGGLVVLGKDIISSNVYNDLLNLLKHSDKFKLNDQSMFSEYFGRQGKIKKLSIVYNCGQKLYLRRRENIKLNLENTKIIHFAGSQKPMSKGNRPARSGSPPHKIWKNYMKDMLSKYGWKQG